MADDAEKGTVNLAARFGAKIKGLSSRAKAAETENATLKQQLATLTTENGQLKQQVLTPDAAAKKIAELTGQIRTGKHKAKFAELAKAAGFPEASIDLLYGNSGHKADTDEPDPEALGAVVERLKGEHAWALGKAGDATTTAAGGSGAGVTPPVAKPIPGQGRGGANNGSDATIITAEQRADPAFMLNPANREAIAAAAREGRFR